MRCSSTSLPHAQRRAERVVLVEDSAGHVVSRAAEMRFQSQFLAHHAAVLALLRAQGRRLIGLLAGVGHSAAFFSNALQASTLYALRGVARRRDGAVGDRPRHRTAGRQH